MNAYRSAVEVNSSQSIDAEAANESRYSSAIEESLDEERAERWVKAIMLVRCVLGPLVLLLLLLASVDWKGSDGALQSAQPRELARATAVFNSFPEQFATRTAGVEAHIEAF